MIIKMEEKDLSPSIKLVRPLYQDLNKMMGFGFRRVIGQNLSLTVLNQAKKSPAAWKPEWDIVLYTHALNLSVAMLKQAQN